MTIDVEGLAAELGASGVCVNTLSPGLTESESVLSNPHHLAGAKPATASRAFQRVEVPEDLVGALLFLAGPASDEEILDVVLEYNDLKTASQKLIEKANSNGGPDNITVVLSKVMGTS